MAMLTFHSTVRYLLLLMLPYLVSCTDIEMGEHPVALTGIRVPAVESVRHAPFDPLWSPEICTKNKGLFWVLPKNRHLLQRGYEKQFMKEQNTQANDLFHCKSVVMDIAPAALSVARGASRIVKDIDDGYSDRKTCLLETATLRVTLSD
ncbi:hypothetical protein BU17DRAFT_64103 [Hysterangium stoloniferum]|nr:hypothetical protein BU17DRAFT_64103 [Hysterangium stoloniferum]